MGCREAAQPGPAGGVSTSTAATAATFVAATTACALALFPIWEQDWGWQVRAGEERLREQRFLSGRDEWSYTALGQPWKDVQWLATSVMGAAHLVGGPAGLVLLRSGLSGTVALGALAPLRSGPGRRVRISHAGLAASVCTWFLAFLALRARLQIRSEMFVFALAAWMPSLAARHSDSVGFMGILVLAVAIAANLHFGVAPFIACHACSLILGEEFARVEAFTGDEIAPKLQRAGLRCLVVFASLFVNPAPIYAFEFFWGHVFYFQDKVLDNPDHVRASWNTLSKPQETEGASLWAWGAATALAVWIYFLRAQTRPRGYRSAPVFAASVVTLSVGCLERVRIVPFAILYLLPVLVSGAAGAGLPNGNGPGTTTTSKVSKKGRPIESVGGTAAWSALAALLVAVHFYLSPGVHVGLHLKEGVWPEDSAAFVLAEGLKGNIYHTFTFGNYLVYAFRGKHLTYGDTRETIFRKNEQEYFRAFRDPAALGALLNRHGVNTIVTKIPGTHPLPFGGWRDIIREFTPLDEWALLFWDDVSVVSARRTPAHAAAIEMHEYRMLRPALPYNLFLTEMESWKSEEVRRFRFEILRCNARRGHTNLYCALSAAAWASAVADPKLPPSLALEFLDRLPPPLQGRAQTREVRAQLERAAAVREPPQQD